MGHLFIKQVDSIYLGPTCLTMVCRHYKKNIHIQTLRDKTQISKEGVNLLGISEAAEQIGFRTNAVKITYQQLIEEALLPAILHGNQNHFVVAVPQKTKGKKITVADPAKAIITFTKEEFLQHWISNKEAGEEEGNCIVTGGDHKLTNNIQ